MKKNLNKTITINGMMAVTKNENGEPYVQFLPDDPRLGIVEPFVGASKAQLLNNGTFECTKKRRRRGKPVFKAGWTSLSFAPDEYDYVVLKAPRAMRYMLAKILISDSRRIAAYLKKEGYSE